MSTAPDTRIPLPERLAALALLAAAFLLRLPYVLHYRFNSDEAQHLHVVWGWTRGLVQYRDTFDNHMPLFHLAMAPVLALVGEHAWAVLAMRFAMLPLWLLALALTLTVARRLYSDRVALWATVLLAVHYEFYFVSLEFRADDLWAVAWLAALAVLVGGPLTGGRAFASGLLLGTAAGVSAKTALLAVSLAAGTALTLVAAPRVRDRCPLGRVAALGGAVTAGLAVVPLLLVASFAAGGMLRPFLSGAVGHNLLPGMGEARHPWRLLIFPLGLAFVLWLAGPLIRSAHTDRRRAGSLVLALTAGVYVLAVQSFWPFITGQDWLPVFPILAILVVAALDGWARRSGRVSRPAFVLGALVLIEVGVLVFKGPVWTDRTAPQLALVRETLQLTGRDDPVIDAKGETVFRRRVPFWVVESVTRERLRRGLIRDTLPEEALAARCWVAVVDDERFPEHDRAFLAENYVPVGLLRVAGRMLGGTDPEGTAVPFAIAIPGRYALTAERGPARGLLDGVPYAGPRELAAGRHEFRPAGVGVRLAVTWATAGERGFSPFRPGGVAP